MSHRTNRLSATDLVEGKEKKLQLIAVIIPLPFSIVSYPWRAKLVTDINDLSLSVLLANRSGIADREIEARRTKGASAELLDDLEQGSAVDFPSPDIFMWNKMSLPTSCFDLTTSCGVTARVSGCSSLALP